jgi:hypothetical protein
MTTVTTKTPEGKQLILANDFFDLLKTKENFLEWLYRQITTRDMEFNYDFYIFLDADAVKELARYESFKDKTKREMIEKQLANNE